MKLLCFVIAGFVVGFAVDKFRCLAITLVIGAIIVPWMMMEALYTMDDIVAMTLPWPLVLFIVSVIVGHICYLVNEQKKEGKGKN